MHAASPDSAYFLRLHAVMPPDLRESVLRRAIEFSKTHTSPACNTFKAILRKIPVSGYREGSRAPTPVALPSVLYVVERQQGLWQFVLPVWLESRTELSAAVESFLAAKGFAVESTSIANGFTGTWSIAARDQAVDEFLAQHPDCDRNEAGLMMSCCIRKVPVPGDGLPEALGEGQMVPQSESSDVPASADALPEAWQAWVDELRQLPADAPEWAAIGSLVDAIQAVAEEKRTQREASWHQLEAAIAGLIENAGDALRYFEFSDVPSWSAQHCSADRAQHLAEKAGELGVLLHELDDLRARRPATVGERRQLEESIRVLEEQILQLHAALSAELGEVSPPPQPPQGHDGSPVPATEQPVKTASEGSLLDATPTETAPQDGEAVDVQPAGSVVAQVPETASQDQPQQPPEEAGEQLPPAADAAGLVPTEAEMPQRPEACSCPEVTVGQPEQRGEAVPAPPIKLRQPCSSVEAANSLKVEDSPNNWSLFLAALVAEDDLPGAYWLARSLAAAQVVPAAPDWLLAAAQGARWLSSDSDALAVDLLQITTGQAPPADDAQAMIGLAAALRPVLIAPATGLLGWLKAPECCPVARDLVAAINDFAKLGVSLHPEDVQGAAGTQQREAAIAEAARSAARWLEEAPRTRPKYKRAADVWRHLVDARGEIHAMLLPVTRDERGKAEAVRELVNQWSARDYVMSRINDIDQRLVGWKARQIDGAAREHLCRDIDQACTIARHWCDLIKREQELATRGDWLSQQAMRLRANVLASLPAVEAALAETSSAAGQPLLKAAARLLQRALWELRQLLNLPAPEAPAELACKPSHAWPYTPSDSLYSALARRLLALPEIDLGDDGLPSPEGLAQIAPTLRDASAAGRSLESAFGLWLEKQDYRFAEAILGILEKGTDTTVLRRRYCDTLAGSVAALREDKERTVSEVEQCLLDGVISEEERAEHLHVIETIHEDEVRDFGPRHEQLHQVRQRLAKARENRLRQAQARWEGLSERLDKSGTPREVREQIRGTVEASLARGDTRVVDEYLAQIEEDLDAGREPSADVAVPRQARYPLEEFMGAIEGIESWLESSHGLTRVAATIRQGRPKGPLSRVLPAPRLREAADAIEAWGQLKHEDLPENQLLHNVRVVLRYLGFGFSTDVHAPLVVHYRGSGCAHVEATMSALGSARPVPQFGSAAQNHYDVVCLWERPSADTIAARLRELRLCSHTVLVFYLGRLTARERRDVTRVTRQGTLALTVLDETLLVFLAQERDARLPAFLRCALPFGALIPYTPFQAGDVPPEMFYGRDAMIRELQLPAGSCLVYGGRQLGKSALLRHVQRLFHQPEREQHAWIENTKQVFEPRGAKGTERIWHVLRDGFRREGLLPPRARTDNPDSIRQLVLDAMREVPQRRVLVMFDEADEFLDADARDDFRVVGALRDLMTETQRRFKVVFAGLHNVQRFQGIPNQPLAHFGTPICVGPLEPAAAEQLVREPLETLGYRFPKDDGNATVLRILSYTNYHPGLIQLFCQELLVALHKRTGTALPPYTIEQSDVEGVYRRPEVRERIRERFDWTLALDVRYQAVAWALIVDQMKARDSYARPYTAGAILQMVREWWPNGFASVSIEELRGGVLEEMVGLGVLVRNSQGHYRLRSPNLVRLMGTEDDIEDRLLELASREAPKPSDSDSHHAALTEEGQRYSPLTYAQERALNVARSGVGLVFASSAQGAALLQQAFRRLAPETPEGEMLWHDAPVWIIDGEAFCQWMAAKIEASGRAKRVLFSYQLARRRAQELERFVQQVLEFSARRRSAPSVRVLLVFDAPSTWAWLSLPDSVRQDLEDRSDAVVSPQQWNRIGLQRRLEEQDRLASEQVCQAVLEATGGWPMLLDNLFDRCGTHSDVRPDAEAISRELSDPASELATSFRQALGLDNNDVVERVLQFIAQEGEVTTDLVTPTLVGGEPPLTEEECWRATEFLVRMGCVSRRADAVVADRIVAKVLGLR